MDGSALSAWKIAVSFSRSIDAINKRRWQARRDMHRLYTNTVYMCVCVSECVSIRDGHGLGPSMGWVGL